MAHLNVEIKARCTNVAAVRTYLQENNADFKGVDNQTDTYFNVASGRLKLREGTIENNLIFYQRENKLGPKNSFFQLVKVEDAAGLKQVLTNANGIKIVVRKKREIYYLQNVKFHIDEVNGLGIFIEIEAGNLLADVSEKELLAQCHYFMNAFSIEESDLLKYSYSDLLLDKEATIG